MCLRECDFQADDRFDQPHILRYLTLADKTECKSFTSYPFQLSLFNKVQSEIKSLKLEKPFDAFTIRSIQ